MTEAAARGDPLFMGDPTQTAIDLSLLLACFTGVFQLGIGLLGHASLALHPPPLPVRVLGMADERPASSASMFTTIL